MSALLILSVLLSLLTAHPVQAGGAGNYYNVEYNYLKRAVYGGRPYVFSVKVRNTHPTNPMKFGGYFIPKEEVNTADFEVLFTKGTLWTSVFGDEESWIWFGELRPGEEAQLGFETGTSTVLGRRQVMVNGFYFSWPGEEPRSSVDQVHTVELMKPLPTESAAYISVKPPTVAGTTHKLEIVVFSPVLTTFTLEDIKLVCPSERVYPLKITSSPNRTFAAMVRHLTIPPGCTGGQIVIHNHALGLDVRQPVLFRTFDRQQPNA